jgi:hypothetical protein
MQDSGSGFAQNILALAPMAYPSRPAAARMAFVRFGSQIAGNRPNSPTPARSVRWGAGARRQCFALSPDADASVASAKRLHLI